MDRTVLSSSRSAAAFLAPSWRRVSPIVVDAGGELKTRARLEAQPGPMVLPGGDLLTRSRQQKPIPLLTRSRQDGAAQEKRKAQGASRVRRGGKGGLIVTARLDGPL